MSFNADEADRSSASSDDIDKDAGPGAFDDEPFDVDRDDVMDTEFVEVSSSKGPAAAAASEDVEMTAEPSTRNAGGSKQAGGSSARNSAFAASFYGSGEQVKRSGRVAAGGHGGRGGARKDRFGSSSNYSSFGNARDAFSGANGGAQGPGFGTEKILDQDYWKGELPSALREDASLTS